MTDWLWVSIATSILSFIITCGLVFYQICKTKPTLLKPAQIITEGSEDSTTYDWNLILNIIGKCVAFATGIFIVSNVVIFLVIGSWYIDQRSVGILAVVFIIYLLRDFDKFITKFKK